MPESSGDRIHPQTDAGILMRCSSRSMAGTCICGAPVDCEGEVLDVLVQSRRNKRAALKLMRKLLKAQGVAPTAVVTDKLPSYGAALSDLGMKSKHITGGRELSPGGPAERTTHATLQVSRFSPEISFNTRRGLQHLQRPTSSDIPSDTSPVSRRSAEEMASGDRCSLIGMFTTKSCEYQPVM